MDNTLLSLVFITFLSKVNNQNSPTFREPPLINTELRAEDVSHSNHIASDDKQKILEFLKTFTGYPQRIPPPMKLIGDASKYCKSFLTCRECSKSRWYPCVWCHNYGCTDRPEKLCPYAVTRIDLMDANSTEDHSELCPFVEHQGTILVPAGVRHNLRVKIHATDPVVYEKEIICQLKFNNRVSHLRALILDDIVYCYPAKLDTTTQGEPNIGFLRLIWGGIYPFSNRVPVTVYRCEYLASDCEGCKLIPPEYGCGWCSESNKCVIADKCADLLIWNVNRLTCKSLEKKMFYV